MFLRVGDVQLRAQVRAPSLAATPAGAEVVVDPGDVRAPPVDDAALVDQTHGHHGGPVLAGRSEGAAERGERRGRAQASSRIDLPVQCSQRVAMAA